MVGELLEAVGSVLGDVGDLGDLGDLPWAGRDRRMSRAAWGRLLFLHAIVGTFVFVYWIS